MRQKNGENSFLYLGGAIALVMTALILMGYVWTPYSPTEMDAAAKFASPSLVHLLGTDNFGRDIFSRVLEGAGTSFLIAACVVAIGCAAGTLIGALCGYYGGIPDLILTRVCDAITAFPSFLLALVIVSVAGKGVGDARILFSHILPNTWSVLLPAVTIGFNNAILSEASMSYLGIGVQPTQASLGSMLNDSQTYLGSAPWYALGVGGTMVLLILGFSLLSEGLQQRARRS